LVSINKTSHKINKIGQQIKKMVSRSTMKVSSSTKVVSKSTSIVGSYSKRQWPADQPHGVHRDLMTVDQQQWAAD
jgi:hypothetical protein